MRIIKSSVAVFCCFLIYLIRQDGVPFYSAIAAILCMQPDVTNSIKVAMNRTIATLIGAVAGLLILMFEQQFLPDDSLLIRYLIVSVMIIPLIYLANLIKKPTAAYITCVVFMSITISHGADVNPYLFAFNRMVDTLIGIFVSLGINAFHLPRRKNRKMLLVCDLDEVLRREGGSFSSYFGIKANQLIQRGAKLTFVTSMMPDAFLPAFETLQIGLPVITMDGAALYDTNEHVYTGCKNIDAEAFEQVQQAIREEGRGCFIYAVIHDIMHVYYSAFANQAEEDIYRSRKRLPYKHYVCAGLPENHLPISLMLADTAAQVEQLSKKLEALPCAGRLNLLQTKDPDHEGYALLRIFSRDVSKDDAMESLREREGCTMTALIGGRDAKVFVKADDAAQPDSVEIFEMDVSDRNAPVRMAFRLFYMKKFLPKKR